MAKGPILDKLDADRFIAAVYVEHPDWKVEAIRNEVERKMRDRWSPYGVSVPTGWPGFRSVGTRVARLKEKEETLPESEKQLDREWSIGIYAKPAYELDLPPDVVGDLLDLWEFCLAIGRTFTIRQAIWAGRIRSAVRRKLDINENSTEGIAEAPDKRQSQRRMHFVQTLYAYASEYALRQQVSGLLSKEDSFDTRDLDSDLAFGSSRLQLLFEAFAGVSRLTMQHSHAEGMPASNFTSLLAWDGAAEIVAHSKLPRTVVHEATMESVARLRLQDETIKTLSESQNLVFALLLRYLQKGPKWDELSITDYLVLIDQLKEYVTRKMPTIDPLYWSILADDGRLKPAHIFDPAILKKVGYDTQGVPADWIIALHTEYEGKPASQLGEFTKDEVTRMMLSAVKQSKEEQRKARLEQSSQKFIDLVKEMGGPTANDDFWDSVARVGAKSGIFRSEHGIPPPGTIIKRAYEELVNSQSD